VPQTIDLIGEKSQLNRSRACKRVKLTHRRSSADSLHLQRPAYLLDVTSVAAPRNTLTAHRLVLSVVRTSLVRRRANSIRFAQIFSSGRAGRAIALHDGINGAPSTKVIDETDRWRRARRFLTWRSDDVESGERTGGRRGFVVSAVHRHLGKLTGRAATEDWPRHVPPRRQVPSSRR
jgi:hypothetical protein